MAEVDLFRILVSGIEIPTIFLGFYCMAALYRRYREKHQNTTKYLLWMFAFLGLVPAAQLFDGIFYPFIFTVKFGYSAAIVFTMIVNVALVLFSTEVFASQENRITRGTIIFRILFILGVVLTTGIATVLKLVGEDVTITLGLYMGISVILFLLTFMWARKLARKMDDPVYKRAIQYISYFAIIFLAVFVFFIADSFYPYYTLWGLIGWCCYLLGTWAAYRGFIRPAKLQDAR